MAFRLQITLIWHLLLEHSSMEACRALSPPPQGRFAGQLLCAGRPVCDIRTSAQELIRARSYDITGGWGIEAMGCCGESQSKYKMVASFPVSTPSLLFF